MHDAGKWELRSKHLSESDLDTYLKACALYNWYNEYHKTLKCGILDKSARYYPTGSNGKVRPYHTNEMRDTKVYIRLNKITKLLENLNDGRLADVHARWIDRLFHTNIQRVAL